MDTNMVKEQAQELSSSFPSDAEQTHGEDSREQGSTTESTDDVAANTDETKFTQSDLDRIVNDRLTRERTKHAAELKKQVEAYARRDRVAAMQGRLNNLSIEGHPQTIRLEAPELAEVWADLPEAEQTARLTGLNSAIMVAVDAAVNERIKSPAPKLGGIPARVDPVRQGMGLQ